MRIRKMSKKEICPYCGERCISFGGILRAADIWMSSSCPMCGASIKIAKKAAIIRNIFLISVVIAFIVLTFQTEISVHFAYWSAMPMTAMYMSDLIAALCAGLRYEESMKYPPKPAKGDTAADGSFEKILNRSIRLCQVEISNRVQGQEIREELEEVVLPELQSLLKSTKENRLPPKKQRRLESLVCARTIWNWNTDGPSELLNGLEELEQEYRDL